MQPSIPERMTCVEICEPGRTGGAEAGHAADSRAWSGERANRLDRTVYADLFTRGREEVRARLNTARRVRSQGHPW